ncbi:MAG: pentapeptide repeat-containing protein [Cyanobacteria bacterium P01_B01_bin.77]
MLVCYLGASLGLDSVYHAYTPSTEIPKNCYDPTQSRFTIGVIVILGIVTLTQTISRSLMAMGIVLPIVIFLYGVLIFLGAVPPPEVNLLSATFSILIMWGFTFLTHCLFRSAIAALDVLFLSPRIMKGLLILSAFLGAFIGSLVSVTAPETSLDCPSSTASLGAKGMGLSVGIIWGLSMALAAWWINYRQRVPWRSPNVFREWALAIGSWSGTSFYNLDLSAVNFQGAVLANTDLRGKTLRHTCFREASGIERAHVDGRYLDLDSPNVQQLLTQGYSHDPNFQGVRLQGAYLRDADMRGFNLTSSSLIDADLQNADLREARLVRTELLEATLQNADLRRVDLTDANLTGADFTGADLRGSQLIRAQVARSNFTDADLTGVCIEDWSVSSQTQFINVRCGYIYRKFRDGEPSARYPIGRDFEPGEFATLFEEPENELEIVFKGEFNYNALSLTFYKLQTDKPELQLKLNGIEQRGELWIVKVISTNPKVESLLEQQLTKAYRESSQKKQLETTIKNSIYKEYEETKKRLIDSEKLIRQLAGVSESQAEALKELSQKSFGNSFFITGSTITNLTGSGNIEYTEAAQQVREIVIHGSDRKQLAPIVNQFARQLKQQEVATQKTEQLELIQQLIVAEAEADPEFRAYLLKESQQILQAMAGTPLTQVIQGAVKVLLPRQ